jgi:hypothetical protein
MPAAQAAEELAAIEPTCPIFFNANYREEVAPMWRTPRRAARRLQAVASVLGREWFAVLQMTVIDDLSWARIGRALGLSPKTAKVRSIAALEALALWFAGKPIRLPPRAPFQS